MKKLLIIIPFLILIIIIFIYSSKKGELKIHVLDAGKADSSILTYKGLTIIIDTGEEDLGSDILKYLDKNKIDKIDYLIITHFDKDHVGSAYKIIEEKDVLNVIQTNTKKDSIYYEKYIESLESKNIKPITVLDNYEINHKDLKIVINGPGKTYDKNESNNSSLITSIYYKKNSFIFMGDSEKDRIKDFISNNDNNYDLIKIPYHGNYQKQLNNLLDNINPKYAIICDNKIDDKMKDLLEEKDVKYYVTKNGSIDIISNGKTIYIKQ
jgi:beta-lactamase superfamily II metal-dependent hydrolase